MSTRKQKPNSHLLKKITNMGKILLYRAKNLSSSQGNLLFIIRDGGFLFDESYFTVNCFLCFCLSVFMFYFFCYFYLLGLLSLLSRLSFNISFIAYYFLYWTSMFFKFFCVFLTLLILSLNLIDFCPSVNVLIIHSFLSYYPLSFFISLPFKHAFYVFSRKQHAIGERSKKKGALYYFQLELLGLWYKHKILLSTFVFLYSIIPHLSHYYIYCLLFFIYNLFLHFFLICIITEKRSRSFFSSFASISFRLFSMGFLSLPSYQRIWANWYILLYGD